MKGTTHNRKKCIFKENYSITHVRMLYSMNLQPLYEPDSSIGRLKLISHDIS